MIDHKVRNIEDLEIAASSSLITPTQLGKAPVVGSVSAAQIGDVVVTRGRFSGDVRLTGPLSETQLALAVLLAGANVMLCGEPIHAGMVVVFPTGNEQEANYLGGGEYLLFTVEEAQVYRVADSNGIHLKRGLLSTASLIEPPTRPRAAMDKVMRVACNRLFLKTDLANHAHAERQMVNDLILELLHCFVSTEKAHYVSFDSTSNPKRIVRQTEQWFEYMDHKYYSVDMISEDLGYSRRRYYRTFKNVTGLSPAHYLKLYRLSRVRAELAHSVSRETTVTDVASEWGFWDLGRFASSYKTYFGEYPSETLSGNTFLLRQPG